MYLKTILVWLFMIAPLSGFASKNLDSLQIILQNDIHDTLRYQTYQKIIQAYDLNEIDSLLKYTNLMIQLADKIGNPELQKNANFNHGLVLFQKYNGSDTAIYFLKQSYELAASQDDHEYMISCDITIASVYSNQGKQSLAYDFFLRSLRLIEQNDEKLFLNERLVVLNNLGRVAFYRKQIDESLYYFNQALPLARELERPYSIIVALTSIAGIYSEQAEYDSAIFFEEQALELAIQHNYPALETNGLGNLAMHEIRKGQYEKGKALILKSIALSEENGWGSELSFQYNTLSLALAGLGKHSEAIAMGEKAVKIAKENNRLEHLKTAYRDLAKHYLAVGNSSRAFSLMELHVALQDSLFKLERSELVEDMKARYDSDKKDAKIQSLDLQNQLLQAQTERDRLIRITFIVLLIVLVLMIFSGIYFYKTRQKRIQLERENELREAENDGAYQRSAELARLIHDGPVNDLKQLTFETRNSMLPATIQAQLNAIIGETRLLAHQLEYRGIATGNLVRDMDRLKLLTKKQYANVMYNIEYLPNAEVWHSIRSDLSVLIFQSVRELIYNAFKHANATRLNIQFKITEHQIQIAVEDNGNGIQPGDTNGIGLKNLQKTIAEKNGNIAVSSADNKGTAVRIYIPLSEIQDDLSVTGKWKTA